MNNYIAGLYIRLSKEDENKIKSNSESVDNQIDLLTKYAKEKNYIVYDTYIDDGYTGTNFNRPRFNQMIKDIENKKINMIIVKDLSRFGRDYILTGYYLEMWFPCKNVRFISILDNYDSINNINEYLPFKSIINDMYSRDNSKKIKAALRIKQQMGKWVGGCPPFGYMQDSKDKNHLVINKEESAIVKKIYRLFLKGYSFNQISNYLYENKISTPLVYRKIKRDIKNIYWSTSTIKTILTNELYTGDLIQNRRSRINYKVRKLRKNDKRDWVVIRNAHDKIINKKDFINVQRLLKEKPRTRINNNNKQLLSGLLWCFECKKRIVLQKINNKIYTICNTYKKYSKKNICTTHSNNYFEIEEKIVKELYRFVGNIDINRELILLLINRIELHNNKEIDIYFNFKEPSFIAKEKAQVDS